MFFIDFGAEIPLCSVDLGSWDCSMTCLFIKQASDHFPV